MTPTTSAGSPSIVSVVPMIDGEAPKRSFQKPALTTTTRLCAASSSREIVLPSRGGMPRQRKEVRRDDRAGHPLDGVVARDGDTMAPAADRELLERAAERSPLLDDGIAGADLCQALLRVCGPQQSDRVGVTVGKAAEQHGVQHTEHGGRHPDTERQRG